MRPVGYTAVNMSQEREPRLEKQEDSQGHPASKQPYQKLAFRYERVFETQALTCGKLSGGGPRCITRRTAMYYDEEEFVGLSESYSQVSSVKQFPANNGSTLRKPGELNARN